MNQDALYVKMGVTGFLRDLDKSFYRGGYIWLSNEDVRVEVLAKICLELGCSIDEIIDIFP